MFELFNFLWRFPTAILLILYILSLGFYFYGIIKKSLIKTLIGIIACTICAFLGPMSIGPGAVLLLIFQEIGLLIMLLKVQKGK